MKRFALAALAGFVVFAQTVVPVGQEPHHRQVFENQQVRVLDVLFPAGETSLFHTHDLDNVSVRLTTGITRTDRMEAEGTAQTVPAGRITFASGTPPYTHRVANLGTTAVRLLDVELLKGTPPAKAPDDLAGHTIVLENEHVRVTRIALVPGESLPAHTHPRGWVEIFVSGGKFEWHPSGTHRPGVTTPIEIVEVEPR